MKPEISYQPVVLPSFGVPEQRPVISAAEHLDRISAVRAAVAADWVVVYADREHFANLAYLCGLDVRFEEALLLLGPDQMVLAVGNENVVAARAAVPAALEIVHCSTFSLMGQPRNGATLPELLRRIGMRHGQSVEVVGWKALEAHEWESLELPALSSPAFVVDALRIAVGGADRVTEANLVLNHPGTGLRTRNSADQIVAFEWAMTRASECVRRVIAAAHPEKTDREAMAGMGYEGEEMSVHAMFASGPEIVIGLTSPNGRRLRAGDAASVALGFWGGLCARAGVVAADEGDLRPGNETYLDSLAKPYWRSIAAWYEGLRLGASGGEVWDAVDDALQGEAFDNSLNPGHHVHLDEWVHTPFRRDSPDVLVSGMALQCDIIPTGYREGWAANCEDGVALADEALRATIAARHPEAWARMSARRAFMRAQLGLEIADEVLPLSNMPGYFAPFWLSPGSALVKA